MAVVFAFLIVISSFWSADAVTLSPCGADNTLEVVENRGDNTVTCSGIPADFNVNWIVSTKQIIACYRVGSSCFPPTIYGYTATISPGDRSMLTIDPRVNVNWVRNGMLSCQAVDTAGNEQSTQCKLDIVYPPEIVLCNIQPITSGSSFTVSGRCDVTKTYSSLSRYSCQWYTRQGSSAETTVGQPVTIAKTAENGHTGTGGTYINGRCDVTMSWPTDDATYSYRVVITPGSGSQEAGTLTIRKPSPSHNCPQYVVEDQALTCTCAGDAGLPSAVLRWDNTGSSMLIVSDIKRSLSGAQYFCQAVLSGAVVQQVVYVLNVAYGPDSATITAPDPFETDGSRDMTLTCSASGSNPSAVFSWTRPGSSEVPLQGQSYSFRPQTPKDDDAEFQCRAMNTITNKAATGKINVNLHYPPASDPTMTNTSSDGNVYQGDNVTFTCTVTGGKPVSATSVTLTCPRTQSAAGTVQSNRVTSSVTMTSVSDDDHNMQCVCTTKWSGTISYTNGIRTSLFINTPPSPPVITSPSSDYPPIDGITPSTTLTCKSAKPGRPEATYTWPVTGGGQTGSGQARNTLTFGTLSREDIGRTVTCKATNLYTEHRQPVVDRHFTLEVYYHPVITLYSQVGTNACNVTSIGICEVTEGQRVHFRCSAVSNPSPAVLTWNHDGFSDTVSADLNIVETNHTVHNRKYTCTVTTGGLSNNRQPLTSSQELTVLVKYKPSKTQLFVSAAQSKNLVIKEKETVVLSCQAYGRPTPDLKLTGGPVAESSRGGVTVLEDRVTWYNTTLTAQCQHTGEYRCAASNSVGEGPTDTAMLFVNCKPRENYTYPQKTPIVNYVDSTQVVSFNLVAYPVPDNFTFSYRGPSPGNRSQTAGTVVNNILQMKCFTTNLLYNVTCNVTVFNITSEKQAGLYGVSVSNAFGHANLEFMITFNESIPAKPHQEPPIGATIGGGIAAAVGVIIVAALIILFIRRRRKDSENSVRGHTKEKKSDKIKLSTLGHSGASSTHDEALDTDVKSQKKPTAVVSPKRKSKSRTHHHKSSAFYENVELHSTARHRNDEHLSSTCTEHSTPANQPMISSVNHSVTNGHQNTSSASEDDPTHPSAHSHTASPAAKKHPPSPSTHGTHHARGKQHSSTKELKKIPTSPSTHTAVTPADADDLEEMEPHDDTKASETALYNDVEYMTSQGATFGLDITQQYLLDKLRGNHLNEEFGKLMAGHQRDCNIGSRGENRSKNRFNNSILPYDVNRVALLGETNDYINASRIRGYSSSKSYIAAQGPKQNTVIDFWKMVWQEKITHIAMLTNLTEGEKTKCAEYWPSHGKHIRYGSVIVTNIDISRRANCIVRTFEIKGSGGNPSRHVSQYHFITWLDHSIPSGTALVDFWRTVSTSHGNQTSHSPLLVHCSAGVGRTGTFIALDIAMETVRDGKEIDVFHIIQRMREDRINMVQTASQYRFVHEAILEAYTSRHARLALLAFNSFLPNEIDPQKCIDKIDQEFKLLNQMKVLLHKPSRTMASSEENLTKNRTVVFPDDNHLVYLSTFVKERNQYINAVLMPTFYDRRGCILTQLPLQNTLVDIWRLVDGNDVTTIVSIGEEVDGTEIKCCYWPRKDGESIKFGPFTITLKSKTTPGKHLTSYELSVQLKNSSESREVSLLQYRGWTGEVPDSTQDLLQLVDLVNSRSVRDHEDEEDKVVVQCLDGATKSGLFRVICDVISRMTYDHDVDVYMAVRHVQIVRPESVTTEVQYRYIYHVIQEYQRRNAVYNN